MPDTDLNRRQLLAGLARGLLGVGLMSLPLPVWADDPAPTAIRTATRLIQLTMVGGMSHLDTLDPKPGTAEAGPVTALTTAVDGLTVSSLLPGLAKQAARLAVIRSLTSTQGAHEQGQYLLRTGHQLRGTIRQPCMGSWLSEVQGRANPGLPAAVGIGLGGDHPGAGYLVTAHAPLPVAAEGGLANSALPSAVSQAAADRRLRLRAAMDARFAARLGPAAPTAAAHGQLYDAAVALMRSPDLVAFDTAQEPEAVRAAYGDHAFGRGCLLARRLVEHGVRAVEVVLGGWDTHDDHFERIEDPTRALDAALPALLDDLAAKGLLRDTLVVLATEFGRTPRINDRGGRDHHPKAFSALLAGGPVRGGTVIGATDATGSTVASGAVGLSDLNATIAAAMGLPWQRTFTTPDGRPQTIADKGRPIAAVLG